MRRGSRQTQRPASEPPGPTVAADDALTSCLGDNGTASLPWALSTATCSAQVRRPASRPSCPSFPTPSQPQRPTPRCRQICAGTTSSCSNFPGGSVHFRPFTLEKISPAPGNRIRRGDSVWWTHGLPPQSRPVAGLYARSLRSAASHAGGPESRPRERQRLNQRRDRARTSPSQTRPFRGPRPAGRTPPAQHPPKSPSWISPRQPLPGGARRHRAAYADVLRPAPNGAGSLRWWRCRRGNRPAPDQGVSGRKVGSTISMRLSAVSKPFHTYLWVAAKHTENSSSFSITSSLAMSQSSGSAPPRAT